MNMGIKADLARTMAAAQSEVWWHDCRRRDWRSSSPSASPIRLMPDAFADGMVAGEDGAFNQDLAAYDLTSGGSPLPYDQSFTVKQQAAYIQDDITAGHATFNLGREARSLRRPDREDTGSAPARGLVRAPAERNHSPRVLRPDDGNAVQREPLTFGRIRIGGRLRRQPAGSAPGQRNQVEIGVQQGFGRWFVADVGYFNKHTDNALRLRRAVQHADCVPCRLGSLPD